MEFRGADILSVTQFNLDALNHLFHIADKMQIYAKREKNTRVLEGAILGNLFCEPSTRTRLSFGSAFNLLGGEVRESTGTMDTSMSKGESLADTAKVISQYSDIICLRHSEPFSAQIFATSSDVPIINGGDGDNEHPTQALLDLYTIFRERNIGTADNISLALVGDLKYGRTAHSLVMLLSLYKNINIHLVPYTNLELPTKYLDILSNSGARISNHSSIEQGISNVDIIYSTRVQNERLQQQVFEQSLQINQHLFTKYCKPNTVLMHPLPRDNREGKAELDVDLNSNPNLAIFRQVQNGVTVRMALFALVLGVEAIAHKYEKSVPWFVKR